MDKYWTRVLKNIFYILISFVSIYLAFKVSIFYIPFLIGFIISTLIEPIIRRFAEHTQLTRKTSAIIILLLLFAILLGLITWGIIAMVTETSNLLQVLNIYIEKAYTFIQNILNNLETKSIDLPTEIVNIIENSSSSFLSNVENTVTIFLSNTIQKVSAVPVMFIYIFITILSTYFICTDRFYILDQLEHHFPKSWVKKFGKHLREIISSLGQYIKAEVYLIFISFIIVVIGLYICKIIGLNIQYPLLIALGIGFVDALPILGSGTVIVPWAIIASLDGDIKLAIMLIAIYVVIIIVRQIMEPKLVSKRIGTHPIFTLIAMYTGFKFIGIMGLLLGPIILIIFKNVFSTALEDGFVKSIFNKK